jgi:hypothetical protein
VIERFSPCYSVADCGAVRRSFDRASGKSPLHMVSAWGSQQRLVLAQVATERQVQRDYGGAQTAPDADPQRHDRDR